MLNDAYDIGPCIQHDLSFLFQKKGISGWSSSSEEAVHRL